MAHLLVIENWYSGIGHRFLRHIHELGHRFTFVSRDLAPNWRRLPPDGQHPLTAAEHILTADTNDRSGLLDFLERQHALLRFDGVATACDYYLGAAAQVAERLGLPGPGAEAEESARLKHKMRLALARAGLPNPGFWLAADWDEVRAGAAELGYPLILKPSDEGGSMFVTRVNDEGELRAAFDRLAAYTSNLRGQAREPLFLLEEYLRGDEVSVEAVGCNGDIRVLGLTDKSLTGAPGFIEDCHMFPAPLDPAVAEEAVDLVRRALVAVGYTHGVSHTEVKLTPDGPRIVEINPRTPGNSISDLIRHVTGIDLLDVVIELALGRTPPIEARDTGVRSAAVKLLLPSRAGRVEAVRGLDTVSDLPNVVDLSLKPVVGTHVEPPSMNAYLGHVIVVDRIGHGARAQAEWAAGQIELVFEESGRDSSPAPTADGAASEGTPVAAGAEVSL
jgi:biotin carboxylase